jgi:hypothetical protein
MNNRDEFSQQDLESEDQTSSPRNGDDRRGDVKPTDNPVPRSPEAEEDSVRAGKEKLDRVKPY